MALSHWSASWPVLLAYAFVVGAHLDGLAGLLGRATPVPALPAAADGAAATRRELAREAALFQAGLLIAALALVSPLGHWADVYLWVRAVQDLLLAFIAPGLMVAGAPWLALRYRRASGDRGPGDRRAAADRAPARPAWLLSRPVTAVVAVNLIWLAWHLPAAADLARSSPGLAAAEHVTYLAAGIVFWLQVIGSRPYRAAAVPLRRTALIIGTVLADTLLGMVLAFGSGVLYPAYRGAAHHVLTLLDDQQLAGAVLWTGMLPPLLIAATAVLLGWLGAEDAAETSAGLDRLLTRPRSSWPSGPGLR